MALSEENRLKLDGIVSQMESNNESPEQIQFVVDDFKVVQERAKTQRMEQSEDDSLSMFPMASKALKSMLPTSSFDDDPILKYGFPGVKQYLKDTPSDKQSLAKASLIGIGDIFSRFPAIVEGLSGERSIGEVLQDPDPGILRGERKQTREYWAELASGTDNPVYKKVFQALGVLGEGGFGAFEDPLGALTSGLKGGARALSKRELRGVPRADLISPEGIPLTPAQAAGKEVSTTEAYAQANPFTQGIPGKIKEQQLEMLGGTASRASEKLGGLPVGQIDLPVRGSIIEKKAEILKDVVGKKFRAGEEIVKGKAGEGLLKSDVTTFPGSIRGDVTVSKATQKMDKMLESIGHTPGEAVKNIGEINDRTIKKFLKYKNDVTDAKNVGELINVKRNIGNEIFEDAQKGLFSGEKNQSFLKGINSKLNESIEESIKSAFPGKMGDEVSSTFKEINKMYSDNLDLMKGPAKKLGLGRGDFNSGNVTRRIKEIDFKVLEKLKTASKKNPEIKAVYDELSKGTYEDVLYNSLNKEGILSPDKFTTNWNKIQPATKRAIFPKEIINEVDKLVSTYNKISKGDLAKLNPSGTARMNFLNRVKTNPTDAFTAILGYLPVKHYYKTGKLPHESALNVIRSTGNKAYLTADKLKQIQKASTLGQFLRAELKLDGD